MIISRLFARVAFSGRNHNYYLNFMKIKRERASDRSNPCNGADLIFFLDITFDITIYEKRKNNEKRHDKKTVIAHGP